MHPELVVAIAEGKTILETEEDVRAFFRGQKGLAKVQEYEVPVACPHCHTDFKKLVTVNWEKGELSLPSGGRG